MTVLLLLGAGLLLTSCVAGEGFRQERWALYLALAGSVCLVLFEYLSGHVILAGLWSAFLGLLFVFSRDDHS